MRARPRWRPAVAAALLASACATAAGAASLEFLHVEANEGGSSGGHVALRFGDAVYHFQNQSGLLQLVRDDAFGFARDYALLENRPIHASRIELADAWEARLGDAFARRLDAQRGQRERLAALRAERVLLEALLAREAGGPASAGERLALPAAGYFASPGGGAEAEPALAALRERLRAEEGSDFFARRRRELAEAFARLAPSLAEPEAPSLRADAPPPPEYGFGARAADLAAASLALEVLEQARPLAADALLDPEASPPLAADEARALERFAERLERSLARLAKGAHGDEGPALLVGLARLAAARRSLAEGRLRALDAFCADAERLPPEAVARARGALAGIAAESEARLAEARARFAASPTQPAWSDVEDLAGRYAELARAQRGGEGLRAQRERLVPSRPAPWPALPRVAADRATLARALALAREREARFESAFRRLHRYRLVGHSCVSELFATVDGAFEDPPRESAAALGGWIDPRGPAAVVPFVAAEVVARRWRVSERYSIPSLRQRRLARLEAEDREAALWLREASPLTARSYARGAGDSFFLFFTDGALWPRPLLGALNAAAAAGETALGLLRAPFDRGRMLRHGLQGAAMSLPELAFVSLRKGTNDFVPDSEDPLRP